MSAFLSSLYSVFLDLWSYQIVSNDIVYISLGNLTSGILLFIVGWRLIRYIKGKFSKMVLRRWIKETETVVWIENFISLLMFILLFTCSVVIIGISPSVLGVIWHFTLFTIQNHVIELGNIILGLFLLYPGIKLSSYISGRFHEAILNRLSIDLSTKKNLEGVFKYILIVIVVLFVMTIVGIPLTAFTIIGGAFAIGVGLGSQNLVNNFLSGLVLMAERPLKIGDIVSVENERGTVENIGARSTRIRTFENVRMVIPNSKLLENTVTNFTLVDNLLRREVVVGVAYGSPVKKVRDLLKQATSEEPGVESSPEPSILFSDFGDNALIFRILFWVQIDTQGMLNPLVLESNLRFRIDELFREAGIVIAFPQRDVHVDSLKPMEVKILNSKD